MRSQHCPSCGRKALSNADVLESDCDCLAVRHYFYYHARVIEPAFAARGGKSVLRPAYDVLWPQPKADIRGFEPGRSLATVSHRSRPLVFSMARRISSSPQIIVILFASSSVGRALAPLEIKVVPHLLGTIPHLTPSRRGRDSLAGANHRRQRRIENRLGPRSRIRTVDPCREGATLLRIPSLRTSRLLTPCVAWSLVSRRRLFAAPST